MRPYHIKRITVVLLAIFAIAISAVAQKVTLKVDNLSVKQAIERFEKASGFKVVYDVADLDLNRKVTFDAKYKPIADVFGRIVEGQNVTYSIEGEFILVKGNGSIGANASKTAIKVEGTILEKNGDSAIGVSVVQKGTTNGTTTDIDGHFTLYVPEGSYLTISGVGFKTENIKATAKMKVTLKESSVDLDEVVVIGYGSAQKSDLTGAMTMIDGDKLNLATTPQTSTLLQGQMSGVQVMQGNGDPGNSAEIRVRGVTTISDSSPLIIVDGMPVESLDNAVSPSDIANIQVLKDAASAAIYGSRAAAGVILITTKRPANNMFRIDYNYEFSFDVPTMRPRNSNVIDYMMAKNEMAYNDAFGAVAPYSAYSKEYIDNYMSNHALNPDAYPATDWMNTLLKKHTTHQRHEFVISGGVKNLKTRLSFNYFKQGYLDGDKDYDRYTFRLNNDLVIARWVKATADITFMNSEAKDVQLDVYDRAQAYAPIYAARWSDGEFAYGKDGDNPLAIQKLAGHNKVTNYDLYGRFQLVFNPIEQLSLTIAAAPNFNFYKGRNFGEKFMLRRLDGDKVWARNNSSTHLTERRNNSKALTLQAYANYSDFFGKHKYNFTMGYEEYQTEFDGIWARRNNYDINGYPYLDMGPENYQYNGGNATHRAYRSVFGRAIYSFDNRYLAQINVRGDGSSRFAKGHRWGCFPSASLGWVINQEPWFTNRTVTNLKLRASWGKLGNERINNQDFPYMPLVSFIDIYQPTSSGNVNSIKSVAQLAYAFRNLTWETTTTWDVGVDVALFNNRLRGTFDYYYKKTSDMLISVNFPMYFGYNSPMGNQADMNTRGWDLELVWRDRVGDLTYNVTFNLSDYRTRMGYMADRRDIGNYNITEKGSYYQEWYGYRNMGIILNQAAMTDANGKPIATLSGNDAPGAIRYVDQNGDGRITPTEDRVRLGNSLPELQYGGAIWIYWKNFDFNLGFQGIGKHMKRINTKMIQPLRETWQNVPQELIGNHWSPFQSDEENAKMKYPYISGNNTDNLYTMSDFWLFNGGYFRIKNITFGYTLPEKLTKRIRFKQVRFYFSANNLPAISKFPKGWDPEYYSGKYILSSYSLGIKLGL